MFIITHTLASIAISQNLQSPFEAFWLSLTCHYLLDIIPHGDEKIQPHDKKISMTKFFFTITTDLAILSVILIIFIIKQTLPNPPVLLAGVLGGVLPDMMTVFYQFINGLKIQFIHRIKKYIRYLPPSLVLHYHYKLHCFFHKIVPIRLSMKKGIAVQIVIIIALIFILR